jgi:hypothetical protein
MKGPSLIDLAARPTAEVREVAATKKAAKERKSLPHISVYVSPAVNREIRKLALELDVKAHDLYLEGIDRMLKAHGRPSIAKIDGKT